MTASFVCPLCSAESFNPNDIAHRYCGRCHVFVDDEIEVRALSSPAIKRLIEEVRLGDARPSGSYNRIYNRHNRS